MDIAREAPYKTPAASFLYNYKAGNLWEERYENSSNQRLTPSWTKH